MTEPHQTQRRIEWSAVDDSAGLIASSAEVDIYSSIGTIDGVEVADVAVVIATAPNSGGRTWMICATLADSQRCGSESEGRGDLDSPDVSRAIKAAKDWAEQELR